MKDLTFKKEDLEEDKFNYDEAVEWLESNEISCDPSEEGCGEFVCDLLDEYGTLEDDEVYYTLSELEEIANKVAEEFNESLEGDLQLKESVATFNVSVEKDDEVPYLYLHLGNGIVGAVQNLDEAPFRDFNDIIIYYHQDGRDVGDFTNVIPQDIKSELVTALNNYISVDESLEEEFINEAVNFKALADNPIEWLPEDRLDNLDEDLDLSAPDAYDYIQHNMTDNDREKLFKEYNDRYPEDMDEFWDWAEEYCGEEEDEELEESFTSQLHKALKDSDYPDIFEAFNI